MTIPRALAFCLSGSLLACGPALRQPVGNETTAVEGSTPPARAPRPREVAPRDDAEAAPELAVHFAAEGVSGSIALYDSQSGKLRCSDLAQCRKAEPPCSTFKIANSMIALETGVVEGVDTVLPWDGKPYQVEDWNHDMTFREALRVSCLPCYQSIARKVGEPRMQSWVERLAYGNRNVTGGVDKFWIWGGLRISPLEQIDFLRRFDAGKLPISTSTSDTVKDMMVLDVGDSYVLRGKTGAAEPPDLDRELGWFVGWLELGERRVFFATIIDGHRADVAFLPARRRVTERVLRALGDLPLAH